MAAQAAELEALKEEARAEAKAQAAEREAGGSSEVAGAKTATGPPGVHPRIRVLPPCNFVFVGNPGELSN